MTPSLSRLVLRWAPSVAGMAAFALFAGLWLAGDDGIYDRLLDLWGIVPFRFPFLDTNGSLAAWDCARRGVDIIVSDPCDVLKRPYNYSPFWMSIDWIPLGQVDRVAVGVTLGLAFLVSLAGLPAPESVAEMAVRMACVLSTMVVFAIERANPDLLIFLLVMAALRLLRGALAARVLAYGLIFLAGAVKYYPFVLLSLMARERVRILLPAAAAAAMGLVVFYVIYQAQILEGLPSIASGSPFGDMFGAKNFMVGVFIVVQHVTGSKACAAIMAIFVKLLLVVMILAAALRIWSRSDVPDAIGRLGEDCRLTLVAGSALLLGCFFSGQNVGYRGIFLIFLLPGLFGLGRDEAAGGLTRVARWTAYGIPVLMWTEGLRYWVHGAATGHFGLPSARGQPADFLIWLVRETAWWFLISVCLITAVGFLAGSPVFKLVFKKSLLARGI